MMQKSLLDVKYIKKSLRNLQVIAIQNGLPKKTLKQYSYICNYEVATVKNPSTKIFVLVILITILLVLTSGVVYDILSTRCLVPINYLVWEATRPLADCDYCVNITKPIILRNITRNDFTKYAYSSKPIIVKNVISHWRATKEFSFYMFKRYYEQTIGSYETFDEGCQFLNFKSDLFSLKEVFNMPNKRVRNEPGQKPWYVGWANCHADIQAKVRQYYSIPEFLPEDAEFPETENIFFGYEIGAVMHYTPLRTGLSWNASQPAIYTGGLYPSDWNTVVHALLFGGKNGEGVVPTEAGFYAEKENHLLDYIPRLMWQGQVKGSKNWSLAPVPECEHVCHKFQYYVEPGDVVLLDTRLWYHATSIPKGQFSMTVQSEYG